MDSSLNQMNGCIVGFGLCEVISLCLRGAVTLSHLARPHDLLRRVHGVPTPGAFLRTAELLREFGRVGVGGGSVNLCPRG